MKAEDSSGGFFMLAHGIFRDPRVQKLSGDAFRLFIWMSVNAWRFKESNGELGASVGYASVGAGISKSSVSRAVIHLQAAGFIQLIATDYRKGNTWKVSNLALYQNVTDQAKKIREEIQPTEELKELLIRIQQEREKEQTNTKIARPLDRQPDKDL